MKNRAPRDIPIETAEPYSKEEIRRIIEKMKSGEINQDETRPVTMDELKSIARGAMKPKK